MGWILVARFFQFLLCIRDWRGKPTAPKFKKNSLNLGARTWNKKPGDGLLVFSRRNAQQF
jgi:hypothetical protein